MLERFNQFQIISHPQRKTPSQVVMLRSCPPLFLNMKFFMKFSMTWCSWSNFTKTQSHSNNSYKTQVLEWKKSRNSTNLCWTIVLIPSRDDQVHWSLRWKQEIDVHPRSYREVPKLYQQINKEEKITIISAKILEEQRNKKFWSLWSQTIEIKAKSSFFNFKLTSQSSVFFKCTPHLNSWTWACYPNDLKDSVN